MIDIKLYYNYICSNTMKKVEIGNVYIIVGIGEVRLIRNEANGKVAVLYMDIIVKDIERHELKAEA